MVREQVTFRGKIEFSKKYRFTECPFGDFTLYPCQVFDVYPSNEVKCAGYACKGFSVNEEVLKGEVYCIGKVFTASRQCLRDAFDAGVIKILSTT